MLPKANPQRILLISTHCIGDSLIATTLSHSLRKAYPTAEIDVLVTERGEMVFTGNPDINQIVTIPRRPSFKQAVHDIHVDAVFKAAARHLPINESHQDAV